MEKPKRGFLPSARYLCLAPLCFFQRADRNEAYLNTLLTLMANVDDTNVLSRTNMVIQGHVKSEAAQLLRIGGAPLPGNGGSEKAESEIYSYECQSGRLR